MRAFFLIILSALIMFPACSGETQKPQAAPVQKDNSPEPASQEPKPDHPGVYIRSQNGFTEMFRGSNDELQTTNADRGFGFLKPVGQNYSMHMDSWTVWTRRLNVQTLQITKLKGVVLLPDNWNSLPKEENIAWLPAYSVPIKVENSSATANYAKITAKEPLEPGFYVLHDDTFVRSRRKEEVDVYYPFVVMGSNNDENPWVADAKECYESLFEQSNNAQGNIFSNQQDYIKKCAENHQLSLRVGMPEKDVLETQKKLIFLMSLARVGDQNTENLIIQNMDRNGSKLEQWFWKRIHMSVLYKLIQISKKVEANSFGGNVAYDEELPTVYNYFLGTTNPPQPDLESLSWIPFVTIEEGEQLQNYFQAFLEQDDWKTPLSQLLAAIELKRFSQFMKEQPESPGWKSFVERSVPKRIKKLADNITLLDVPLTYAIGPVVFSQLTEEEQTDLRVKVYSHTKQLESCINTLERQYGKRPALLIFNQFLNLHVIGHDPESTLKNPFAETRRISTPAFDNEFMRCTKRLFVSIKVPPSLDSTKKMTFPIILGGQFEAPWKR